MNMEAELKNTPIGNIRNGLKSNKKALTPQPSKGATQAAKRTPKSAPPPKRKTLSQEIDDEISDEEFDTVYEAVKDQERHKVLTGTRTPKKDLEDLLHAVDSDEDNSDLKEDGDVDLDEDDLDEDDLDEDDDDEDDKDDEDEDDVDDGDENDDIDENDSDVDDSEEEEDEASPSKKSKLSAAEAATENVASQITNAKDVKEYDDEKSGDTDDEEDRASPCKKPKLVEAEPDNKGDVGEKQPEESSQRKRVMRPKVLFIRGFPDMTALSEIQKLFDCPVKVQGIKKKGFVNKFCNVVFEDEEEKLAYLEKLQGVVINGSKLLVDHSYAYEASAKKRQMEGSEDVKSKPKRKRKRKKAQKTTDTSSVAEVVASSTTTESTRPAKKKQRRRQSQRAPHVPKSDPETTSPKTDGSEESEGKLPMKKDPGEDNTGTEGGKKPAKKTKRGARGRKKGVGANKVQADASVKSLNNTGNEAKKRLSRKERDKVHWQIIHPKEKASTNNSSAAKVSESKHQKILQPKHNIKSDKTMKLQNSKGETKKV